tara:strand:- start:2001 stop:2198 length:198 start_codon:yes stop_codon:yes gene_type:complete
MIIAKEDLQHIRNLVAENGIELTPLEAIEMLKKARPDLIVKDIPGLLTELKQDGNISTSGPPIDS